MICRNFKLYIILLINIIFIVLYGKIYTSLNNEVTIVNQVKLNVDQRSEPNIYLVQQRIAKNIPYLPIEDLQSSARQLRNYNFTCAWYPDIMSIKIQNEYWQILYSQNLTYNIFGAYLDTRPLATKNKTIIRILAMINLISEKPKAYPQVYCQIWFREKFPPIIVPVSSTRFIWLYIWGHDPMYSFPHILSCVLPKAYRKWKPKSVSLVANPCDLATNIVRVIYRPLQPWEKKKDFAVCIKALDFLYTDLSQRLVEYIETLRILGAQKIMMYYLQAHENITKVLSYYQSTGFLEYRPFSSSLKYSNLPEFRHLQMVTRYDEFILHESIAYNDCVYRNMYRYKYLGVWDIDEVPLPLNKYTNWHDLVEAAKTTQHWKCKNYASLCFLCAYFPRYEGNSSLSKQFPDDFYMLQHVQRVKEYEKYASAMKCFLDTERVIATHNHFPIHFAANCRDYTFPSTDAQMNHYREPPLKTSLTNPVIDKQLWRFGNQIVEQSLKIIKKINFIKKL